MSLLKRGREVSKDTLMSALTYLIKEQNAAERRLLIHCGLFRLTAIITIRLAEPGPRLQGRGVKPPMALIRGHRLMSAPRTHTLGTHTHTLCPEFAVLLLHSGKLNFTLLPPVTDASTLRRVWI